MLNTPLLHPITKNYLRCLLLEGFVIGGRDDSCSKIVSQKGNDSFSLIAMATSMSDSRCQLMSVA